MAGLVNSGPGTGEGHSATLSSPVFEDRRARYLALAWLSALKGDIDTGALVIGEAISTRNNDGTSHCLQESLAETARGLEHVEIAFPALFGALNSRFPVCSSVLDYLFETAAQAAFANLSPEFHAPLLTGLRALRELGGEDGWDISELETALADRGLDSRFMRLLKQMPSGGLLHETQADEGTDTTEALHSMRETFLRAALSPAEDDEILRFRRELEISRGELLDLGLRSNPRINFRPSRGNSSISIKAGAERTGDVFRILVREGQSMSFDPVPAAAEGSGAELPGQPTEEPPVDPTSFVDLKLQTSHTDQNLQQRLRHTSKQAELYLEAHGSNGLYLCLGMLHWREAGEQGAPHSAPLVMVPVSLTRSSSTRRFRLQYTGEDIVTNDTVLAKMKAVFGLELPQMREDDAFSPDEYLQQVESAVAAYLDQVQRRAPYLRVERDEMHISVCREGSGLLLRDLKEESWPERPPYEKRIIRALLGRGFEARPVPALERGRLDDQVNPSSLCTVVDVDSSQLAVVLHSELNDLDVEGPPGCGKTQTIINIISQALAGGKTVLIVSEKPVALEVIRRKLEELGLGASCLELHSEKTTKKHVIDQLRRAVSAGKPIPQYTDEDHGARVAELQRALNAYRDALREPVGNSGVSPFEAMGNSLLLRQQFPDISELPSAPYKSWSAGEFAQALARASLLEQVVEANGAPRQNVFWGVRRSVLSAEEQKKLFRQLGESGHSLAECRRVLAAFFSEIGLSTDCTPGSLEQTLAALQSIAKMPEMTGINVSHAAWGETPDLLGEFVERGERHAQLRRRHDQLLDIGAWSKDLTALATDLRACQGRWWGMATPAYLRSCTSMWRLCKERQPWLPSAKLAVVEDVLQAKEDRQFLAEQAALRAEVYGSAWQGVASDWKMLRNASDWCTSFHALTQGSENFGQLLEIAQSPQMRSCVSANIGRCSEAFSRYRELLGEVFTTLQFDGQVAAERFATTRLDEHEATLSQWLRQPQALSHLMTVNRHLEHCRDAKLDFLVSAVQAASDEKLQLASSLRYGWYESLSADALSARRELDLFQRERHELTVQEYREQDRAMICQNIEQLACQLYAEAPRKVAGGRLEFLSKQLARDRGHCATRQLMAEGGAAVQRIAKIFLASPASIPKFIPPEIMHFDHGLVDEGSQMPPIHLLPVGLRVALLSVFGDKKQLPPFRGFEGKNDRVAEVDENTSGRQDNALEKMSAAGAVEVMLEGHYRSRHESNIRVSNRLFYQNRLRVFPSPWKQREGLGLRHRLVESGVYDYSKTSTNVIEARAVAEAALQHSRTTPHLTLGIGTLSAAQMEAVETEVEKLRLEHPDFDEFCKTHTEGTIVLKNKKNEPLFIKNHENIQGDERDIIFVSIGYGFHNEHDADGQSCRRLYRQFGSINKKGGERGLNTLMTRSRLSTVMFSNFRAVDLQPVDSLSEGVRALAEYLEDAELGDQSPQAALQQVGSSALEDVLATELRRRGYMVTVGIGDGEGRVNLGVKDPNDASHEILGILIDDHIYQDAKTARDHDRIKFEILELNGWNLHQVWAPECYADMGRVIDRIEAVFEKALAGEPTHDYRHIDRTPYKTPREEAGPVTVEILRGTPYQQAELTAAIIPGDLAQVGRDSLRAAVRHIVEIEHPVHEEVLRRRLRDYFAHERLPAALERELIAVLAYEEQAGRMRKHEGFLYSPDNTRFAVRDRSSLSAGQKRFTLIPPEEIEGAVQLVVMHSCGIKPEDVPTAVCRVLGFQSEVQGAAEAVQSFITSSLQSGLIEEVRGYLQINAGAPPRPLS